MIEPDVPEPDVPEPDDKDWTWVLDRPCTECGYNAGAVDRSSIATRLIASSPRWKEALSRPGVAERTSPGVWSVLEYACHTRDVHEIFGRRARLILDQDDPRFENWDQDRTALEKRYWEADPVRVADEIEAEAADAAAAFTGLSDEQWARTGKRSNGSEFTMETLGLYYLHDIEHHLSDIA